MGGTGAVAGKKGKRIDGKHSVLTDCHLGTNMCAPEHLLTHCCIALFAYVVHYDEGIPSTLPPEVWPPLCWSVMGI